MRAWTLLLVGLVGCGSTEPTRTFPLIPFRLATIAGKPVPYFRADSLVTVWGSFSSGDGVHVDFAAAIAQCVTCRIGGYADGGTVTFSGDSITLDGSEFGTNRPVRTRGLLRGDTLRFSRACILNRCFDSDSSSALVFVPGKAPP